MGRFLFEPGFRVQVYASLSEQSYEPRLAVKYNLTDKIRLKGAAGMYSQNLMAATSDRDVVNLFYGFLSGPESVVNTQFNGRTINSALQTAIHYVGGVELDLGRHASVNIEGFFKDLTQVTNINRDKKYDDKDPYLSKPEIERKDYVIETGHAYGGDILYRYEFRRIYFWAVYSLTFVDRYDGTRRYFPSFDRRHNFNVVGTYSFGEKVSWSVNVRWNIGSGFPFTQTQGFYEQVTMQSGVSTPIQSQNGSLGIYYGPINTGRLPWFHRLDASISKKIIFSEHVSLTLVAGCTNIYDRPNIFYFDRVNFKRVNQLPIMPTLGINFSF
jgi:hypothetical protein